MLSGKTIIALLVAAAFFLGELIPPRIQAQAPALTSDPQIVHTGVKASSGLHVEGLRH